MTEKRNKISIKQLDELIKLRLETIKYDSNNIEECKDSIVKWYLTVKERINRKN